ncbi:unnamed protein product, partial [Dovyalis caffra]
YVYASSPIVLDAGTQILPYEAKLTHGPSNSDVDLYYTRPMFLNRKDEDSMITHGRDQ